MSTFTSVSQDSILLRFDVDYDPLWAAEVAAINRELGIVATFFLRTGSSFYNVLDPANYRAVQSIKSAHQKIGLHYHHVGSSLDLNRLQLEFDVLRRVVQDAEPVVAWHNPEGDLRLINQAVEQAGFISVYSDDFFGLGNYVSDSNCSRTPDEIVKFVKESEALAVQVLLHPVNWVIGGYAIEQVLVRSFRRKLDQLLVCFQENRVWAGELGEKVGQQVRESL